MNSINIKNISVKLREISRNENKTILSNLEEALKIIQSLDKNSLNEKQREIVDKFNSLNGNLQLPEEFLKIQNKEEKDKIYKKASDEHSKKMINIITELCNELDHE